MENNSQEQSQILEESQEPESVEEGLVPNQEEAPPIEAQLDFLNNLIAEEKSKVKAASILRRNSWIVTIAVAVALAVDYGDLISLPTWVLFILWITLPMSSLSGLGSDPEKNRVELDKLESRKRLYFSFLNINTEEAYFDQLVKINVENLGEYYSLVKIHTARSFTMSSFVALAGFTLICLGLISSFVNNGLSNISYLSTASGLIVEFIAGTMFWMYSKTVRQLKAYHDSLLDVQNILLSFKLIEGTDDAKEKSKMTQKMIEFLVGRRGNKRE